ncbi:MAG: DegQ family serine endoprotease [Deltaproteobacteria bacterium]|jgi:serine protease Do
MRSPAFFRTRTGSFHYLFFLLLAALIMGMSAGRAMAVSTLPASFADLTAKLAPTVVNIYTTQTIKVPSRPHEFFFNGPEGQEQLPEMFRRFFGMPEEPEHPSPHKQTRTSLGSGVITTADGYILTNNHLVEGADEINIKLSDSEEYQAKIIGRDPKTDLALLKIKPKHKLQFATFGDSDKLRVGDWVIAIGNPFGFEQTVTAGIVSGKSRVIGGGPYDNFIQTDASINPGNSGGPLFNMDGKMVGVNTAIYSRSGGNIGIGFAIPVNMVRNIMQQLKEHGKVVRGWLGVMIQQVTPELADQFGLERPIGALVAGVSPNSPAAKAGIKPGDVIVEFRGTPITQMNMLPARVAETEPGTEAKIVLIRDGKRKEVTVTVAELKEGQVAEGGGESTREELGLTVQELTPELAHSLGIEDTTGLLISDVDSGSPAAQAGLRRGDIILEVNRRSVDSLGAFNKITGKVKSGQTVLFLVKRGENTLFVALKKK